MVPAAVKIQNGQTALALKMPDNYDDAYEIYVNGQLIGHFGQFTPDGDYGLRRVTESLSATSKRALRSRNYCHSHVDGRLHADG